MTHPSSFWRPTRRGLLTAAGGMMLAGTAGAGYAGIIEPGWRLDVTSYALTPTGWPANLPLSIAVISDLHVGGPHVPMARVERIVETANALNPDLIVCLGDYEANHRFVFDKVPARTWASALGELRAPLGVYAILGNHDWWHNSSDVRAALDDTMTLMENDVVLLEKSGQRFWLAGLGDQLAHYIAPHKFRGVDDLPGATAKLVTDDPAILLAHEPDVFPRVPARYALTLSGHTHGGQVYIPGLPNPFLPSLYGLRYRYGHIIEKGRHLVVSGGIGMSTIPVRFGVPPEIVHITLGSTV